MCVDTSGGLCGSCGEAGLADPPQRHGGRYSHLHAWPGRHRGEHLPRTFSIAKIRLLEVSVDFQNALQLYDCLFLFAAGDVGSDCGAIAGAGERSCAGSPAHLLPAALRPAG